MPPLYEILIAGFLLPAFYFGWQWVYRVMVMVAVAKVVGGMKDKALNKLKGDNPNDNGNAAQM